MRRLSRSASPRTLREAIAYFSEPARCLEFAVALRWPEGVACPTCGGKEVAFVSTRQLWKCRREHPRRQFSVKVGTIFEDSPIGLNKWFAAIWMVANRPEDVTANEIARELAVTEKTARYIVHRIGLAMRIGLPMRIASPEHSYGERGFDRERGRENIAMVLPVHSGRSHGPEAHRDE